MPDAVVDQWVKHLPGPNTAIVSLLGTKPNGMSEFSFYSFYPRASLQEWLATTHPLLSIKVVEHPTRDFAPIPAQKLIAITQTIEALFSEGHTIVLVDSGGETRTGQVCAFMGLVESSNP